MQNKRAQLTLFVIISLIVIFTFVLIFYLIHEFSPKNEEVHIKNKTRILNENNENYVDNLSRKGFSSNQSVYFFNYSNYSKNTSENISNYNLVVNNLSICGDGICSFGETIITCSSDCKVGGIGWSGSSPGKHEGLFIGDDEEKTEVIYYVPQNFNSQKAEYWFLIHGAGFCHRGGALAHINQWVPVAERENLVLIAPVFDRIYYGENGNPVFDSNTCDFYGKYCGGDPVQDSNLKCSDYPYETPRSYLWDFVYGLSTRDSARQDEKIFEIFYYFNSHLMSKEAFNLYGHSGGGQFVARFMMLYPEKLDKIGVSAAGTMMFPDYNYVFPFGLIMNEITSSGPPFNGYQRDATDLAELNSIILNQKIARLLDENVLLVVGDQDDVGNCNENPTASWQGCYDYEKMENYFNAMLQKYEELKDAGILPKDHKFKMKFSLLPGAGHDHLASGNFVINYFYPPSENCEDTDGGKNYFVKGYTTKGLQNEEDYCSASSPNVLREFYCENNQIKWESHMCFNGCGSGVCL